MFRRSVFAVRDIEMGEQFSADNLRIIRPGFGIKPKYLKELIGKKSGCVIRRGEPISEEILEKIME